MATEILTVLEGALACHCFRSSSFSIWQRGKSMREGSESGIVAGTLQKSRSSYNSVQENGNLEALQERVAFATSRSVPGVLEKPREQLLQCLGVLQESCRRQEAATGAQEATVAAPVSVA